MAAVVATLLNAVVASVHSWQLSAVTAVVAALLNAVVALVPSWQLQWFVRPLMER